jgi:hypothetical protein
MDKINSDKRIADLTVGELQTLISGSVKAAIDEYFENLEALQGQNYIQSISEAREDYKTGKITNIDDIPIQ